MESVHHADARGGSQRGYNGRKDGDDGLQDFLPSFFFHKLSGLRGCVCVFFFHHRLTQIFTD